MMQYSGFKLFFSQDEITQEKSFSVDCLSVNFMNNGVSDTQVVIGQDKTKRIYNLSAGDSITFPEGGNTNPLLKLQETFTVFFPNNQDTKNVFVTITNAIPKVLTY